MSIHAGTHSDVANPDVKSKSGNIMQSYILTTVVSYVVRVCEGEVLMIIYEEVCLPSTSFPDDGHSGFQNNMAGHQKDFINNISF